MGYWMQETVADPGLMPLKTGLSRCYDAIGREIPCAGTGQDGEFQLGPSTPIPRFKDLGEVVEDRLTGLVWTKDANPFGYLVAWAEALESVAQMNQEAAFGITSWRLPNRRELRSILDLGQKKPSLPAGHPFKNVFNGWYWTSTTFSGLPRYAWWVHLEGARMFYGGKDQYALGWPVSGKGMGRLMATGQKTCYDQDGAPISCRGSGQDAEFKMGLWMNGGLRFKTTGNRGVLDRLTGLEWSRDANLSKVPVSWDEALSLAREINLTKASVEEGWRLPNINELESLVDCEYAYPALAPGHPFEDLHEIYWSSTTSVYEPDWAWALYLGKGATGVGIKSHAKFSVWLVRGPLGSGDQ